MKINEDILVIKKSKSFEYMQYKRLLDLGINHAYIFKSDKVDFKNTYSDKEFESLRIVCDELDMNFDNLKAASTGTRGSKSKLRGSFGGNRSRSTYSTTNTRSNENFGSNPSGKFGVSRGHDSNFGSSGSFGGSYSGSSSSGSYGGGSTRSSGGGGGGHFGGRR